MNVEKKLRAYVDKVEQKYDDFSFKDKLTEAKKDFMQAIKQIDRSDSPPERRSRKSDKENPGGWVWGGD